MVFEFDSYNDLINFAKSQINRFKGDGNYYESHHIVPKSEGGNDNPQNLVLLTIREHVLAHYLRAIENKDTSIFYANIASALMIIHPRKSSVFLTNDDKINAVHYFLANNESQKILYLLKQGLKQPRPWAKGRSYCQYYEYNWYMNSMKNIYKVRKGYKGERSAIKNNEPLIDKCPICDQPNSKESFACCKDHEILYYENLKKERSINCAKRIKQMWQNPEIKSKIKKSLIGKNAKPTNWKWFTNGTDNVQVINGHEIPEGFYKGRFIQKGLQSWSETSKQKMSDLRRSQCYVYKDGIYAKSIDKNDLQEYINSGWIKGKNPNLKSNTNSGRTI